MDIPTRCWAWLGPGSPETDGLFSLAARMSASDYHAADDGGQGSWRPPSPPEAIREPAVWTSLLDTLRLVIEHAYWRRAWIIQECLLAHDISFCVGAAQVSWEQFSAVHMMLLDKSPRGHGLYCGAIYKRKHHPLRPSCRPEDPHARVPDPARRALSACFSAAESTDPARHGLCPFPPSPRSCSPAHPGGPRGRLQPSLTTTSLYFRAAHAYLVGDSSAGRPHRTFYGLRTTLHLTPLELLDVVLALTGPDELLSPARWMVSVTGMPRARRRGGRFETNGNTNGLAYMDCHAADFATLVRLLDAKEGRGMTR